MSAREDQVSAVVREVLRQNGDLLAEAAKAIARVGELCAERDAEKEKGRQARNVARSLLVELRAANWQGMAALLAENPWLEDGEE